MAKKQNLTQEEKDQLAKILNEDSDIWTAKGYGSGILCEDAESRQVVYSSKAEREKMEIQHIVEQKLELELAKQQKALKLAIVNFDSDVLKLSAETQLKYQGLLKARREAEAKCEELKGQIQELRQKRNGLKSQKKALEKKLECLERQEIPYVQKCIEEATCEAISSLEP